MAIIEVTLYSVECDKCKEIFEHPMSGFTAYGTEYDTSMYADNSDWFEHEGNYYCPSCHKRHEEEDLVTILTDPPITVEC